MDKDKPLTAGKLSLLFHPNIFSYNQTFTFHIFINVAIIPITHNNILQCLEFEQCCAALDGVFLHATRRNCQKSLHCLMSSRELASVNK